MTPVPVKYPGAVWEPLADHSAPGRIDSRNLIVLHITEGSTAASAIATFKASVHPHRVSAHFVIDRDGTVYQLVDLNDTAWHASMVNSRSVGIEHAAVTAKPDKTPPDPGLPATEEQYVASAKLIAWLCNRLGIPRERTSVKTHNEASPVDGHVLCCTGALDPDRVVEMSQSVVV